MKESGLKQEVKDEVIQAVKDSVNKVVTVLSKSNLIIMVEMFWAGPLTYHEPISTFMYRM